MLDQFFYIPTAYTSLIIKTVTNEDKLREYFKQCLQHMTDVSNRITRTLGMDFDSEAGSYFIDSTISQTPYLNEE